MMGNVYQGLYMSKSNKMLRILYLGLTGLLELLINVLVGGQHNKYLNAHVEYGHGDQVRHIVPEKKERQHYYHSRVSFLGRDLQESCDLPVTLKLSFINRSKYNWCCTVYVAIYTACRAFDRIHVHADNCYLTCHPCWYPECSRSAGARSHILPSQSEAWQTRRQWTTRCKWPGW